MNSPLKTPQYIPIEDLLAVKNKLHAQILTMVPTFISDFELAVLNINSVDGIAVYRTDVISPSRFSGILSIRVYPKDEDAQKLTLDLFAAITDRVDAFEDRPYLASYNEVSVSVFKPAKEKEDGEDTENSDEPSVPDLIKSISFTVTYSKKEVSDLLNDILFPALTQIGWMKSREDYLEKLD